MRNIALEVFQMVINNNGSRGMAICDEIIMPELGVEFQLLDFTKADQLFEIGLRKGRLWLADNGIS